ncbi:MAG: hypothetical protein JSW50_11065 [Candidatus Latescibacterota bacterium]|nr:MAG: hypothetical protein JSW50_11065 [Candidatus Latescibacterota bacterium]
MDLKFAFVVILVLGVTLFLGCSESPTGVPASSDNQVVGALDGPGDEANGVSQHGGQPVGEAPLVAIGHFKRQEVDAVAPDGSVSVVSFQASFIVFPDGNARGSFSLFNGESMTVYQITAGFLRCENDKDIVVLTGKVQGADEAMSRLGTFEATATEDDDNPECLIWDIKDGCSHEAQGKFDVFVSACL